MKRKSVNNVRVIRNYCEFLREAKRLDESSIDGVTKALNRWEEYNSYKDFKSFHYKQAVAFKRFLLKQKSAVTGNQLSKSTINTTLRHLKSFFQWLSMQNGYRSKVNYIDTEYFNLSEKDARIASAKRNKPVPKIEQVIQVLETMPNVTSVEKRDRALIAFTLLTGARDSAIASLKIKHVNIIERSLFQDAREVNTKFSKTFTTYFFPVGELALEIIEDWIEYLTKELLFEDNAPLFPNTKVSNGKGHTFSVMGLQREHWKTASPIRRIFKQAFKLSDLPTFNPHSFRNTLVQLGETLCNNPEEFKAWSQNLGHEGVLTTFYSYGVVADHRQAELLKKLGEPRSEQSIDMEAVIEATMKKMMASPK